MSAEGHLPEVPGPDPCTVTTFASRQLLELLAAVLHVPSLHAAHVASTPALAAQIKGPQVEAALMQPLLAGETCLSFVPVSPFLLTLERHGYADNYRCVSQAGPPQLLLMKPLLYSCW